MSINSIRAELTEYAKETIKDIYNNCQNIDIDDLHHDLFNADYYIIYHSEAKKWLERHNLDAFDAITLLKDYQIEHFGIVIPKDYTPEYVVNQLVYFIGFEIGIEDIANEIINSND
jgi:hypothetical protein